MIIHRIIKDGEVRYEVILTPADIVEISERKAVLSMKRWRSIINTLLNTVWGTGLLEKPCII